MMLIVLSILTNAALYLIFKWFEKAGVRSFPAIVVNYITALSIALFQVDDLDLALADALQFPLWSVGGFSLGIVFISVFYLASLTAQRVGVSVTTIASKMSMVFVVLLFVAFGIDEGISTSEIIALILALTGVVFASMRPGHSVFNLRDIGWPMLLLAGSTIIDFGIAYFSGLTANDNQLAFYRCTSFSVAGFVGIILVSYQLLSKQYTLHSMDVIGGIILGIVNYASLYFLIEALHKSGYKEGVVICLNNVGVVLTGTIAAVMIFRERLSMLNIAGILFSVLAIALLAGS